MLLPTLLSEISSHDFEVAETLIGVLRFVLILGKNNLNSNEW